MKSISLFTLYHIPFKLRTISASPISLLVTSTNIPSNTRCYEFLYSKISMLSYFGYRSEYLNGEGTAVGVKEHFAVFVKY